MYRPHTLAVGKPDLFDGFVPVLDEVAAPVAQRQRVVVAQVLLVHHLEPDVLGLGDDAARAGELPVGEDVAVDEPACRRPSPVLGPGDAVVEQQCAVAHLGLEEAEVRRIVLYANVFGQPDGGDRVEAALPDVAVVGVTYLGQIGEALFGDRLLRPGGLLLGQRDADGLHPVPRGVAHHAAPAAPDVEQPVAFLEPQLLEHQPVLVLLRLFQRGVGVSVARAGVRHRRAEHPFVERVGNVVVMVDGFGVTGATVPQPFCDSPPARQRLLRRRCDRLEVLDADGANDVGKHPGRWPLEVHLLGERLEQLVRIAGVHAVRFDVAGDVRAGQPQLAGCGGQVGGATRGTQIEPDRGVFWPGSAAVVRGELQRHPPRGEDLQDLGQREFPVRRSQGGLCMSSSPLHRFRIKV